MWFGAHLHHRLCLDAIHRAGVAGLRLIQRFFLSGVDTFLAQVPIILFSLVGVIADRMNRRDLAAGFAVCKNDHGADPDAAGVFQGEFTYGTLCLSFGFVGVSCAILWRSGLSGAFADAGGQGRNSNRHRNELDPIQPGARDRADVRRHRAHHVGAAWCFGFDSLSFIAVIVSLYMINGKYIPAKSSEPILDSMRKGIGFIRQWLLRNGRAGSCWCSA